MLLAAPTILPPFPTAELIVQYHPQSLLRRPLPGRTAPIDMAAISSLLGFEADYAHG